MCEHHLLFGLFCLKKRNFISKRTMGIHFDVEFCTVFGFLLASILSFHCLKFNFGSIFFFFILDFILQLIISTELFPILGMKHTIKNIFEMHCSYNKPETLKNYEILPRNQATIFKENTYYVINETMSTILRKRLNP